MMDERSTGDTSSPAMVQEMVNQQDYLRSLEQQGESSPAAAPVAEESSAQPEQPLQTVASQVPSAKDKESNLRIMRENAERVARERDEAIRRVAIYEQMLAQQQPRNQQPEKAPQQRFEIQETDDLADYKTVSRSHKINQDDISDLRKQQQMLHDQIRESQFKVEHPDWQKVMSEENIKAFGSAFPEIAKTIVCNPDHYERAKSTYTMLKRFGIYEENPYESEKNRALDNMNKPRPAASVNAANQSASPMARANAYDNALSVAEQKRLWKETNQYRKGSF